jgi:hypothetical protein
MKKKETARLLSTRGGQGSKKDEETKAKFIANE